MPTLLPFFLKTFLNKYNKVRLHIEELTTDDMIKKLADGYLDAGIAATPLENEAIVEKPLYYEPFIGFVSEDHRLFKKDEICEDDLDLNDILLLEDGHCFKNNVINLCQSKKAAEDNQFQLESGSIGTLIRLSKEGLGMTLIPYLNSLELAEEDKKYLRPFASTVPAREVSLVYHKSQLKMQMLDALKTTIDGVIRGAITFHDVKIISPLSKAH
jgi:LysR family hydrogen peroxide-inducible transcriptional activator